LRSGDVDIVSTIYAQLIKDFAHQPGFTLVTDASQNSGEPLVNFIMLNNDAPPLNDVRVRRALAHATNQQVVVDDVFEGLGQAVSGPFVPGNPWYVPTGYPSYDPAQARALVRSYERDHGPVSFEFGTVNSSTDLQVNQLLQQMWQQVGIRTQIRQFEQTQYIANALLGHYQAYAWMQFDTPDPDGNYVWWSMANARPIGQLALNFARLRDRQIQAAMDTGRTNPDPSVRLRAYQQVGRRLGADCPYIWLSRAVTGAVASSSVRNFNNPVLPNGRPGGRFSQGVIPLSHAWKA
ncbi:MAG TPA: ABC transporter substrate-binding protein, partial [Acidimicrobiales bacterium]|nr:ABC transporter substrate-binding protein [Acidimicrobiales bacterium]